MRVGICSVVLIVYGLLSDSDIMYSINKNVWIKDRFVGWLWSLLNGPGSKSRPIEYSWMNIANTYTLEFFNQILFSKFAIW